MGAACGRCGGNSKHIVDSHVQMKVPTELEKLNQGTADLGDSPYRFGPGRKVTLKQKGAVIDARAEVDDSEVRSARVNDQMKTHWEVQMIAMAVQRNSVLTNLTEDARDEVIGSMKSFQLEENEVVFEQGQPAAYFFVIGSGSLEVLVNNVRVKVIKTGDSFGERALLHNTPRTATVRTLMKSVLWGLDRKSFHEAVQRVSQRNYRENLDFLDSVPLFSAISAEEKENLLAVATTHRFPAGTKIVEEGEPGDLFYLVKKGTVSCSVRDAEVRRLTRGDYFGEQSLLYNTPRTASVTSLDSVQVLTVHREQLKATLGTSLQRIIYRNTQRIVLDKMEALRALTSEQKEKMLNHIEVSSYMDGEVVIAPGTLLRDAFRIVLNGQLKTPTGPFAATFEVVGEQHLLRRSRETTTEPVLADGFTDIAIATRVEIEAVLGGDLAKVSAKNEALAALQEVFLFHTFTQQRLERLLTVLRVEKYMNQEHIVRQNEVGDALFIVKSGKVQVVKDGVVLRTINKRGFFGERSVLLSDVRTASVISVGESECWVMHQRDFLGLVDESVSQLLVRRMELQDDSIVLSDLSFVKVLGKGSFGSVFLVIHRLKKTLYALKSVHRRKIAAYDIFESLQVRHQLAGAEVAAAD